MERLRSITLSACFIFFSLLLRAGDPVEDMIRETLDGGDLEEAKIIALAYYKNLPDTAHDTVRSLYAYWLGNIYQEDTKFDLSNDYYDKALFFAERAEHLELQMRIMTSWGVLFSQKGDHFRARHMIRVANEIATENNWPMVERATLQHLGNSFFFEANFDSAYYYYSKVLALDQAANDTVRLASTYQNIGATLMNLDELDRAQEYLLLSSELNIDLGYHDRLADVYENLLITFNYRENRFVFWVWVLAFIGACALIGNIYLIYSLRKMKRSIGANSFGD